MITFTKIIVFILILLLSFRNAYGSDVTYIEKDVKAPYNGYLFSPEKTKEVRAGLLERDGLKTINESLESSMKSLMNINRNNQEKVDILLEKNDKLAKSLYEERQMSDFERLMWFGLGVVGTGLAIYGASQITK
jgi:hypothetical protein